MVLDADSALVELSEATGLGRAEAGGKATVLAELAAAGFAVPAGFVVTATALTDPRLDEQLTGAARRLGGQRFAVRSSGAAEDLPEASYAGMYETYLDVPVEGLAEAVRRCFVAAGSERVRAYHHRRGGGGAAMAVLVQVMVEPVAAGVAFTAHPVTGDREQTVVTAVAGLGDPLVSGQATGEEWTVSAGGEATMTRSGPTDERTLTPAQATAVAALAGQVADFYRQPQDVEWAIDDAGRLWLVQARPMTALPAPVSWAPPGPGLWMRNFRLGEWLPEPVTPLFGTWLLPMLEAGYLDGMHATVGVRVPFRYALVNGWYYTAPPIPSPVLLGRVLARGRSRALKILYNALVRVGRNPAAADRAVLSDLHHQWRDHQLPRYRQMVAAAEAEPSASGPHRLVELVDRLSREAGVYLWYLAIVGGSAWKMEACLTRFIRRHLADVLPDHDGGAQVLLRGLPATRPAPAGHDVSSADWYHPVASELADTTAAPAGGVDRHTELAAQRAAAEQRCVAALADRPRLLDWFERTLAVNQRYAGIREQQAADFTLAWPVLRTCARRLGQHLAGKALIGEPDDVFFCTRAEIDAALTAEAEPLAEVVAERRAAWNSQRRSAAPLTLGQPPRLIGDVIDRAVQQARGSTPIGDDLIVGHPASAGRATGPVRIVNSPDDFASFAKGDVLVAKATAPAWTPLFGHAAAVVTDGGTLAAHASLVAREFGIPAVVGTGNATHRLHTGQSVTVDGTAGTVAIN